MKATITKREYDKRMAELVSERDAMIAKEEKMKKEYDGGLRFSDNEWSDLYDKQWQNECQITTLERVFSRRYWTASDYAMADMIAENRD